MDLALVNKGGWPTLSDLVPGDAPPLSRLLCDRVGGKQNASPLQIFYWIE